MADLEDWLVRQERASIAGLAACISATGLVGDRQLFAQRIVPRRGSVVASPVTDLAEGEPDYFFHWMRDSALAMEVVLMLAASGERTRDWAQEFRDFVRFSLDLAKIDGAQFAATHDYRTGVADKVVQFLRPKAELARISGPAVSGDVRVNPDGTLDNIHWSRPQHDGPALRALACLKAARTGFGDAASDELLRQDLDYTIRHHTQPCFDIWEERSGEHYYTRLAQYAALRLAASQLGEARYEAAADALAAQLDDFWSDSDDAYLCAIDEGATKRLDMANVLGVLHAGLGDGPHSVADPRAAATLAALEAQFAEDYPMNRRRAPGAGLALGRFRGDVYVTAGPWYLCCFGAAEFRYRRAALPGADAARLIAEGDAIIETARTTVPASGALTEQFDPDTGRQSSARDLGWSHASFLTALAARRAVVRLASSVR